MIQSWIAVTQLLLTLQYKLLPIVIKTHGVEGNLVQGKPPSTGSGFRSQAELVQAMSDPRYDSDPAYRQDVARKLERSNISF